MFHSNNQVVITPVANGYVVTLPQTQGPDDFNMPFGNEEQIRKTVRIMQDEVQSDDILKQLKVNGPVEDTRESDDQVDLSKVQLPNVFIFPTFSKVLDFLKYKISDTVKEN